MVFLTYTCEIHIFSYDDAAEQHPRCQLNTAKRAGRLGLHSRFVHAMSMIPQASATAHQLRIDVTMCSSKSEFWCMLFVGTFICCDKQCRVKHIKFTN